jgi:hypothetical protein
MTSSPIHIAKELLLGTNTLNKQIKIDRFGSNRQTSNTKDSAMHTITNTQYPYE